MTTPRVRFAPSPTGYLHVGGARTALFNWLHARQTGGTFILRMEDTDAARNTKESRETIFRGLRWLGLAPDEGPEEGGDLGPYSQSERGEIYAAAVADLRARGVVYPCFCTRERLAELRARQEAAKERYGYDRCCLGLDADEVTRKIDAGEAHTLRLRVPEGETVIDDLVRGEVKVAHADVEDIILVRADGAPVYNFVVVIDDHHMGVSCVLRGEDHLTNTFKQVILFKALGFDVPLYGHLPLILGPKGQGKLSKRKHPEAALEHYIDRGFHPEAVVNWLALIGWSLDDKTTILSRDELVQHFSLGRISKSGARLDLDKLEHLSGHYIREMDPAALADALVPFLAKAGHIAEDPNSQQRATVEHLAAAYRERLVAFSDVVAEAVWAFQPVTDYEGKASKNLVEKPTIPALLRDYADALPDPLPDPEAHEAHARAFVEERGMGFGQLVHPLRAAWTGRPGGPPLFDCAAILGRKEAHARLLQAATWSEENLPES
ncbi:MAG: glutamate--tRNA ligase [Planctomycetes bacterium]|nr:glutamate--tRNA ligase [Planctomycetota bacterium]